MPPEAQLKQMSNIEHLLRSGGAPFLVLGIMLAIGGCVLLCSPRRRRTVVVFAVLSLLPGFIATGTIYSASVAFTDMANNPVGFKIHDFATLTSRAMSCGIFGLLATIVPSALAIVAFARSFGNAETDPPVA
mgnify:CR=1 FL=1